MVVVGLVMNHMCNHRKHKVRKSEACCLCVSWPKNNRRFFVLIMVCVFHLVRGIVCITNGKIVHLNTNHEVLLNDVTFVIIFFYNEGNHS